MALVLQGSELSICPSPRFLFIGVLPSFAYIKSHLNLSRSFSEPLHVNKLILVVVGNSWIGGAQIWPLDKNFSPGFKRRRLCSLFSKFCQTWFYTHPCHPVAVLNQLV